MDANYHADLTIEKNRLVVYLRKDDNKKVLLEDENTLKDLQKIASTLEFPSIEKMLGNIREADENSYHFERDFENKSSFDFDGLKTLYKSELQKLPKTNKNVQIELATNLKKDIAASIVECILENYVYQVIHQLNELMIKKLSLNTSNLQYFERLVEIFGKNAKLADIQIEIVNND